MKATLFPVAMLVLLASWTVASAAPPAKADAKQPDQTKSAKPDASKNAAVQQRPYLGLVVEPMHPSVSTHLPKLLGKGQGVLVSQVTPDSPAAEAGIQQDDIIATYGDQKVFSAEQLAKLVMADKQGQKVDIGLVRGGKMQTVQATVGQTTINSTAARGPRHPLANHPALGPTAQTTAKPTNWESFDSLTLKRVDDKNFIAQIKYLDKNGKMESHVFKGTREEIEKQVTSEQDLPDNERSQLLNAIEHPQPTVILPRFGFDRDGDFFWFPAISDF